MCASEYFEENISVISMQKSVRVKRLQYSQGLLEWACQRVHLGARIQHFTLALKIF